MIEGADERVDLCCGMNAGDEGDFESAGGGVKSVLKHVVEVAGVGLLVTRFGVIEVVNGFFAKEGGEHASSPSAVEIGLFLLRALVDAIGESAPENIHFKVGGFVAEKLDGFHASGDGNRVTAQGAGLVDGAEGGEMLHNGTGSTDGSDGETPSDDFAERGDIGMDAAHVTVGGGAEAEAVDDFVENQEGADICGGSAETF